MLNKILFKQTESAMEGKVISGKQHQLVPVWSQDCISGHVNAQTSSSISFLSFTDLFTHTMYDSIHSVTKGY